MWATTPPKFQPRSGDLKWGRFNYPVTPTQKKSLEGIEFLLSSLPRSAWDGSEMPVGGFYSQRYTDGAVIIGLNHRSVSVKRDGRIEPNAS